MQVAVEGGRVAAVEVLAVHLVSVPEAGGCRGRVSHAEHLSLVVVAVVRLAVVVIVSKHGTLNMMTLL